MGISSLFNTNTGRILAEVPEVETPRVRARKITEKFLAPEELARSQSTVHAENLSPVLGALAALPKEIVQKIADHLPPESVTKFAMTNRRMLATLAPQFERAASATWKNDWLVAAAEEERLKAREAEAETLLKIGSRRWIDLA